MGKTKINWGIENLHTWNVTAGCTKCSPGCLNCWAEKSAERLMLTGNKDYEGILEDYGSHVGWNNKIKLLPHKLDEPLRRKKPTTYFVCSMSDLFHKDVSFEFISKVFDVIWKANRHTYLLLTKRPKRLVDYLKWCKGHAIFNDYMKVHLGVTVCNQQEADEKIPILLQTPAAHHFVSFEPLLGDMGDVWRYLNQRECKNCGTRIKCGSKHVNYFNGKFKMCGKVETLIDRIIIGAENAAKGKMRYCPTEWIINLVEQAKAAGVDYHVKQIHIGTKDNFRLSTNRAEWPEELRGDF